MTGTTPITETRENGCEQQGRMRMLCEGSNYSNSLSLSLSLSLTRFLSFCVSVCVGWSRGQKERSKDPSRSGHGCYIKSKSNTGDSRVIVSRLTKRVKVRVRKRNRERKREREIIE